LASQQVPKAKRALGIDADTICPEPKKLCRMPKATVYDHYIFLDGSCPNNRNVSVNNRAGFGIVVFANASRLEDSSETRRIVQVEANIAERLHGPVVSGEFSDFFIGSEKGSNNTGELSGFVESLLWLIEFAPGKSALLLYDSGYAAKACCGRNKIEKNRELAMFGKHLYHLIRGTGVTLNLEHVKGHSNNAGNDMADKLANEGASTGSFCNGGRFSMGHNSPTTNLFAEFAKMNYTIPQFYCDCTINGCAGKAEKRIVQSGVNASKEYWRCAAGACDFFSWD
jgi:ribonuclease HI